VRLQEGIPLELTIENQQLKYFKFVNEDPSIDKISFSLNTHHGDPDIYVSRTEKYPSKSSFEKGSTRAGRFIDQVEYTHADDGTILRTFYIGVTGTSYSTFSLLVNTKRSKSNNTLEIATQISEGI